MRTGQGLGLARWAPLVAAALLVPLVASFARAEPPGDAKDLFARGRELRAHGDCAGAVAVFRQAHEVYPEGLGSLRNIAECQEATGKYASARRTWLDLKHALQSTPSPRYDGWTQDADEAEQRLSPKVATLVVDLRPVNPQGAPVTTNGIEVTVNGEPLSTSVRGAPLDRDPGPYLVRAVNRGGRTLGEETVDLGPGDAKHVALPVVVVANEPTSQELKLGGTSAAPTGPEASWRAAGWAALGVGAASLVGAGISLAVYQSARGDLARLCPNYHTQPCDPSLESTVSRGQTASTMVNVLTVAGLIGGAGGAVLLTIRPGQEARAAIALSPTSVSVTATF
jgi:hypothetical protein